MSSDIEAKSVGEKAEMIAGMEECDKFMILWGYIWIHVAQSEINMKIGDLKDYKVCKMTSGTVLLEKINEH